MVQNLSGKTLKGYELVEKIGEGGFGAVYRAYQPLIKRDVALKVILPDLANTPEFVRRFEAEAQLVANLEHPYMVPLYDYWRDADGAFLVMRWLRGGSLKDVLQSGHWPLEDIPRVLDQVTSALAVAHRRGVIHRDIKPENILLDDDKNAYLADFGIAIDTQRITDSATFIQDAESGRLVGSPDFMSPEQIQMGEMTSQTDIYALGIVLYMMLTGRKPYEGDNLSAIITSQLYDPIPNIRQFRPELPEDLNGVLETATQKTPEDRYPDVISMAVAFRQAMEETGEETIDDLDHRNRAGFDLDQLNTTDTSIGLSDGLEQATQVLQNEPDNPYKGLRAFQEADADDFFGRAEQVKQLQEQLQASRFIALIGPSGSGKSSLVRAGLIPALRQEDKWFITDMTPGTHPLEELEAALLRVAVNPPPTLIEQLERDDRGLCRAAKRILPGGDDEFAEAILFIDQFEEAFTQVEDEDTRVHFLNLLKTAAEDENSRLRIILTLRADLYDRPLMYPDFGELIREYTEVILPLGRDELQDAVRKPAERARLELEDGLVADIIADVSQQPGMLPMMQYALTELFERRDGNMLTKAAYQEIGGVSGALAQRADELYKSLDETSQNIARQIFLRLVTLGDGTEDTRRRVKLAELLSLEDPELVQRVIDQFGKYRLLTFDHDPSTRAPTVEIAHEALIRRWDQLRQWLDESRDDLRAQRRLIQAAREWQQSKQDPSFLLTGTRLVQFEEWRTHTTLSLTEIEQNFLAASIARRDEQARLEAERAAREAALEERSRNVLRVLAGVMSIATVIAVGLSLFAFDQRNTAITNANAAATARGQAQENAERARTLAFTSGAQAALAQDDTDLALLLGVQAAELSPDSVQVMRTLADVAYTPGTRRVFEGHSDRIQAVAYSPDGTTAVSAGDRGEVILWDVESGEEIRRFEGHAPLYRESEIEEEKVNIVYDVAFSPDGSQIITGAEDNSVILWDVASGEIIHRMEGHTDVVKAVAFSPDGQTALSSSHDSTLMYWDLEVGEVLSVFGEDGAGHTNWVNDVAFSQSGFTALSGSADGSVILWNIDGGQPILQLQHDDIEIYTIRYTLDELGFLTGSSDGALRLWTFEAGQPIRRFDGHTDRVTGISFNSDGTKIVTSSQDDSIILWDFNTGNILQRYLGHTDRVYDIAFSPLANGQFLSAGWDRTLRLWDTQSGAQAVHITTHNTEARSLAISSDGQYVASGSEHGEIRIWNVDTPNENSNGGLQVLTLQGTDCDADVEADADPTAFAVRDLVFTPDGETLISGSRDGEIREWDVETGALVRCFGTDEGGHSDIVYAVDVHPSGEQLISGSRDNSIIFWDMETGEQVGRYFEHTFHILDVEYSPDGRLAVSAGRDANVLLWDTSTFEIKRRFEVHDDWLFTATFSPDGRRVLSGGAENNLILWNVASGQPVFTLEGHDSFIHTAAFSPTGEHVVSGSADGQMILWDIADGTELQRISGHADDLRRLKFASNGTVLSASDDGTVRLWRIQFETEDLLEWVNNNRHLREPRCGERDLYNIEPLCPPPTPIFDDGTV